MMSDFWLPLDQYSDDLDLAANALGGQLYQGTLALMLGAGASKGMGLPNWWQLVRLCREEIGLSYDTIGRGTSNEELRELVGEVETRERGRGQVPGSCSAQSL